MFMNALIHVPFSLKNDVLKLTWRKLHLEVTDSTCTF